MNDEVSGGIGDLAARAEAGDQSARDTLFATLYQELHRLAQAHVHRNAGDLTLGATTLLHEAYIDISRRQVAFPDRNRFLGYASRAMRGLIIDYARSGQAEKRGGSLTFTTLTGNEIPVPEGRFDLEQLGEALNQLALLDSSLAELVDLKFFCGFSFGEIAAIRDVSERTVQRDWAKARLLLHHQLTSM